MNNTHNIFKTNTDILTHVPYNVLSVIPYSMPSECEFSQNQKMRN